MSTVRVLSHAQAVRGATRHFLRHGTLDMDVLADELAVSRATLYRLTGSRDTLLGDVLVVLGSGLVDVVTQQDHPVGVDGVIEVSRQFAALVLDADPLRRFAAHEPEVAHRVLLALTGRVHGIAVEVQRDLFVRVGGPLVARAADLAAPGGPRTVDEQLGDRAFLYVRVLESVLYAPMLAGHRVEFAVAEPALRALLSPVRPEGVDGRRARSPARPVLSPRRSG